MATDIKVIEARDRYITSKKDLRKLINASKREHWRKLCNELDKDIWGGQGYKMAMKGLKSMTPYDIPTDKKKEIVLVLFPRDDDPCRYKHYLENANPFSMDELSSAVKRIKGGKAPGLDGIPPEAIKEVMKVS